MVPSYSNSSRNKLATCNHRLRKVFNEVIKTYDCTILEGFRDQETQDEYYRTGKSKLQWPKGKHNKQPSRAVDVAPYPIDWNDTKRFYHFAGYVMGIAESMDVKLRWGGDWDGDLDLNDQTFMDLVHFELDETD